MAAATTPAPAPYRVKALLSGDMSRANFRVDVAALQEQLGECASADDGADHAPLVLFGERAAYFRHGSYAQAPYAAPTPAGARRVRAAGGIELIAAPPGPWCGWRAESSSYFDRLWRTGIRRRSTMTRSCARVSLSLFL